MGAGGCSDCKTVKTLNLKPQEEEEEYFYKIKRIGGGSFGEIFLVMSDKTKIQYIAKIIEIKNPTPENLKIAYNEAKILKKCNHQNIILFKEVFKQRINNITTLNIITEYCDDGDLEMKLIEHIENKKYFEETQLINWLMQLSLALKYIHNKNIIHRDIKPSNIFLTKGGYVKLGDFGLSKIFNKDEEIKNIQNLETNETEDNSNDKKKKYKRLQSIKGTPSFLAPEMLTFHKYTEKVDIWALGITFFWLMYFDRPYKGRNLFELCGSITLNCRQNTPKLYDFSYSKELVDLVERMMSRDPNDRPSAEEILNSQVIQKRMNLFLESNNFNKELISDEIKEYEEKKKKSNENKKNLKEKEIIEKNIISDEIIEVKFSKEEEQNKNKEKETKGEYEMNQLLFEINNNLKKNIN